MSETSPEIPVKAAPPPYRIYSAAGVTWATVLGGTAAGGAVLALNYWRWGKKNEAWGSLLCGLLLLPAIIILAQSLPENVPSAVFLVPQFFLAHHLAKHWQGRQFDAHVAAGGRVASNWAAAGIGSVFLVLFVAGLVIWVLGGDLEATDKRERLDVGTAQQVVYSEGATRETAEKLRDALKREGLFTEGHPMTVFIVGTGSEKTVSFIVQQDAWEKPQVIELFQEIGGSIAPDIGGKPLTVRLLDDELVERKRIRIE